ncbi:UvrD/REP helicase [Petrotoga mobilis SJ95]|uniref:DNA 3'-5' helicase n=1 Tax=Petrotoga mobilis (strain DSM 10674 / SJ95) TaxID=403833 RepID=A9BHB1_PETMO|nr:ATP-dependent helicase [Petrotoga mobilis]ABX31520.1 UvrD/REP helicase [Petrotoga mobilis SJ95]
MAKNKGNDFLFLGEKNTPKGVQGNTPNEVEENTPKGVQGNTPNGVKEKFPSLSGGSPSSLFENELDEEQREAVIKSEGRSIIVAGPGSGKTRVITYKIAYLLNNGVEPENILLVTFTRAAAREMIERVKNVTNRNIDKMLAGTFHHVCNSILRKYATLLDYKNNYSILDKEDSKDLLKMAKSEYIKEISDNYKLPKEEVIMKIISYSCNTLTSLRESILERAPYLLNFERDIEQIWSIYIQLKKDMNAMDYDDLLVNTLVLFKTHPEVLNKCSSQFKYVLVDEFQDTNKIQIELVEALSSVHGNLIVVGDDSQSIYSFRGALFKNVKDFIEDERTKVFKIQSNYRSTSDIVGLINHLIPSNSVPKVLKPKRKSYLKPFVVETFDDLEQADAVVKIIEDKLKEGLDYKDIAVLYRSHSLSMVLQQKLDSKGIPYRILSGLRFIETAHIKDILAFLKVLNNPLDKISWSRILKLFPGIGNKTASKIYEEIETGIGKSPERGQGEENDNISNILKETEINKFKTPLELLTKLFDNKESSPDELIDTIYKDFYQEYSFLTYADSKSRNMDIERFSEIASRYDSVSAFIEDLTLSEEIGVIPASRDKDENKLTLTTIHGAKGLEWKVVILISVNPGDFPNGLAIKEQKLDEEERLFYVAITRAKNELYILKQLTGTTNPYLKNSFYFVKKENDFIKKIPEETVNRLKIKYK